MSHRSSPRTLAVALAAALVPLAAACGDSTGPEERNFVQVTLRKASAGPGPVNDMSPSGAGAATGSLITLPDVQSITVTVNRVEVLPVGSAAAGGWVSLPVINDSKTVDLLTLPESGNGTLLASSDLEPGDYRNVRLFFSGATITFRETVTVRGASGASEQEFEGGTPHQLTIPGGQESGLELTTESFTVPGEQGEGTVRVLADVTATLGTIVVTEQGLIVNPVLEAETASMEPGSGPGS